MFCGILKHVTLVNYWIRWVHRGDFTLLDQWVDSKWVRNFSFWYPRSELFWLFASSLNHVHLWIQGLCWHGNTCVPNNRCLGIIHHHVDLQFWVNRTFGTKSIYTFWTELGGNCYDLSARCLSRESLSYNYRTEIRWKRKNLFWKNISSRIKMPPQIVFG